MKKLFIFLSIILSLFTGFSLAISTILNPSYSTNGNDTKIYRTDNSNGGNINIKIQNPKTKDEIEFGPIKTSEQVFTYTKQRDGEQEIRIIPDDGGDEIKFTISSDENLKTTNKYYENSNTTITRTVIPVVPKTGPSTTNIIGIILTSLLIFSGYIYVKKKADI